MGADRGSGVVELVAGILLLVPSTVVWRAIAALDVTLGAIASHLTKLWIEVQGDSGLLFGLALTVLVASVVLLVFHRDQLPLS